MITTIIFKDNTVQQFYDVFQIERRDFDIIIKRMQPNYTYSVHKFPAEKIDHVKIIEV